MGAVNICLVPWFYLWLAEALAMVKVWPPTLVTTAMVERASVLEVRPMGNGGGSVLGPEGTAVRLWELE